MSYTFPHPIQLFVCTKMDLEESRKVSREELEQFAAKFGSTVMETSAKTGAGVQEAFRHLAGRMMKLRLQHAGYNEAKAKSHRTQCAGM